MIGEDFLPAHLYEIQCKRYYWIYKDIYKPQLNGIRWKTLGICEIIPLDSE